MSEIILRTENLSKSYKKRKAVDSLNLEVYKGDVFGFLGPNGAGKSTTIRMLFSLIFPDEGKIELFGKSLKHERKDALMNVGGVVEKSDFYLYLSGYKNLELLNSLSGKKEKKRIMEVLDLVGLKERAHDKVKTYSHGMKQRLGIAQALVSDPKLIILDEPTNGLDPQGIVQIRELIMMIAREGTTILLASHLLDEVQKICTHVAVLSKGTKLFDGKVSEVLAVSDSFELAGDDMEKLLKVIREHPAYQSHLVHNSLIQVYFKEKVLPGALNNWLFSQGVILSHLSERKRSLEQHFLELLQNNQ